MNAAELLCAIRGPLTLITVGVLFALNNFTQYKFWQTWPVLLIVFGLLSLARRGVERRPPEPAAPPPGPPWIQPPPGSAAGYRQSSYPDAASRPPETGDAK